ncbi:hypothetical protein BDN72DRAFT_897053 [Pluteus cervinus]|uniref:Uncharacterized protein n=1 Tax=Pluteus cervinus TaxID=181527 RepID=A0ACD3AXN5_9AGAR|nr:hypothetical protein BDN72DRAFT_897053 [Pluteus cervinus]
MSSVLAQVGVHSSDPHADTRRKIDTEIIQLEARLVVLKLDRNRLAPITRLHPEILQEIFFLAHICSKHKGRTSLIITWVSHGWREIAHHTAALWSQIDFTHLDWVEAALSLAKNRALEFNLDCTGQTLPGLELLVSFCRRNVSRINKLKIISETHKRRRVTFLYPLEFTDPASELTELHLQRLSIPPKVFSGHFPSLRTLHLSRCAIDWDTLLIVRRLKDLIVTNPSSRTTVDCLLKILYDIGPDLEQLQLENVFAEDPVAPSDPQLGKLEFKKLTLLNFREDTPRAIELLLTHVSLPPQLDIEITLDYWEEGDMIQALISARNLEKWPIERLEVTMDGSRITLCIIEDGSKHLISSITNKATDVQFSIRFNSSNEALRILQDLPIHPIQTVTFFGADTGDAELFHHIRNTGTVQHMCIHISFLETLLRFFRTQVRHLHNQIRQDGVIDPSEIQNVQDIMSFHNLGVLQIFGDLDEDDVLSRDDFTMLHEWLVWRKRCGLHPTHFLVSEVIVPSIKWLNPLFEGVVTFQASNVMESEEVDEEAP